MGISDKRKLWLMINCCVTSTPDKQNSFAERFVDSLNEEEIQFCLKFVKHDYNNSKELMRNG